VSGAATTRDVPAPEPHPLPGLRLVGRVSATLGALLAEAVRVSAPPGCDAARSAEQAMSVHRLSRRLAELNGIRVRIAGELPRRTAVLVCNHLGYWDVVVLGSLLPLAPIAKSELARWPLLGRCGKALGALYVSRGQPRQGARVLRLALRRLVGGVNVLNFPEGTTTDGAEVLPFHRGIFGIAARAGVPVVPVALRLSPPDAAWLGGEAFVPHYWRHWRRGGWLEASVRFGPALQPREYSSAEACAAEARARVTSLLGVSAS
jgi:lyso-ornithine lipid O-acyltransferase